MNRILSILALSAICVYFFTACSNNDDDWNPDNNVITCNGKVCTYLVSAFDGGGIADPEEGLGVILNIFDKSYTSYPSGEVPTVRIGGLYHPDKTYKGNGDHLQRIHLGFVDKYYVSILLNQGVYEGKETKAPNIGELNAHVSSVIIHSYSLGKKDSNGNRTNANIHITITMDDSSVIEVKYSGKVLFDGMC